MYKQFIRYVYLSQYIMSKISDRILELRVLSGLESGQLATLCGWSAGTYSHKEKGRRGLSFDEAVTLCSALEPRIGDRLLYLVSGRSPDELKKAALENAEKGFIHSDEIYGLFNDIIARAVRTGTIDISGKAADDMMSDLSQSLADICYKNQKIAK